MKQGTLHRLRLRLLALGLLALFLLGGCGGSSGGGASIDSARGESNAGSPQDGEYGWAEDSGTDGGSLSTPPGGNPALQNAKMILEGSMDLQTQDFDETDTFLRSLTIQLGGYLESTSVSGEIGYRYASYTARVPQEMYDAFFLQIGERVHVRSSSSEARNITEEYVDLEARLATQQTKHARLITLLEKADTMEAIVALQTELANTEYEIERLTGSLRRYDSLVDFSTVYLDLREVRELDPVAEGNSFVNELRQAFLNGTNGVLSLVRGVILLAVMLWPLTIVLIIALIILVRRLYRTKFSQAKPPTMDENRTE